MVYWGYNPFTNNFIDDIPFYKKTFSRFMSNSFAISSSINFLIFSSSKWRLQVSLRLFLNVPCQFLYIKVINSTYPPFRHSQTQAATPPAAAASAGTRALVRGDNAPMWNMLSLEGPRKWTQKTGDWFCDSVIPDRWRWPTTFQKGHLIFTSRFARHMMFPRRHNFCPPIWAGIKTLGWHSIESWLIYRDPYFMAYYNPYIIGQDFIPYVQQITRDLITVHLRKQMHFCQNKSNESSPHLGGYQNALPEKSWMNSPINISSPWLVTLSVTVKAPKKTTFLRVKKQTCALKNYWPIMQSMLWWPGGFESFHLQLWKSKQSENGDNQHQA